MVVAKKSTLTTLVVTFTTLNGRNTGWLNAEVELQYLPPPPTPRSLKSAPAQVATVFPQAPVVRKNIGINGDKEASNEYVATQEYGDVIALPGLSCISTRLSRPTRRNPCHSLVCWYPPPPWLRRDVEFTIKGQGFDSTGKKHNKVQLKAYENLEEHPIKITPYITGNCTRTTLIVR